MFKNKKAIAKATLSTFVLGMVLPVSSAFAAPSFKDVDGHWAESVIEQWAEEGLMGGYPDGTFQPNKPITRAEFIKVINKALGFTEIGDVNFKDVKEQDWYYKELAIALAEGYISGYAEDNTFRGNKPVTRVEAASFIAKALDLKEDPQAADGFTDYGNIPAWAKGAVGAVVKEGVMSGYPDGTFLAERPLTRAEAVSALAKIEEESRIAYTFIKDGEVLKDQTIEGDVLVSESVKDGSVTLSNVTIKGTLIVEGGGYNTVTLNKCKVDNIVVDREKGTPRLALNSTAVGTVVTKTPAKIEGKGTTTIEKVDAKMPTYLTGELTVNQLSYPKDLKEYMQVDKDVEVKETVATAEKVDATKKELEDAKDDAVTGPTVPPAGGGGGGGGGSVTPITSTIAHSTANDVVSTVVSFSRGADEITATLAKGTTVVVGPYTAEITNDVVINVKESEGWKLDETKFEPVVSRIANAYTVIEPSKYVTFTNSGSGNHNDIDNLQNSLAFSIEVNAAGDKLTIVWDIPHLTEDLLMSHQNSVTVVAK